MFLCFPRSRDIISNLTDDPIFPPEDTDSVISQETNSLVMHSVNQQKSSSEEGKI
jgi:hypothetical protein